MITAHFINPLIQYGFIEFDLVIEGDDIHPIREHQSFSSEVSNDTLKESASKLLSEQTELPIDIYKVDRPLVGTAEI